MTEFSPAELARLREIAALDLVEPIDDPQLQTLVERAARELDLPIAALSIVLDSSQLFMASTGLGSWLDEVQGTPVEWSFCRHAVASKTPFQVDDAEQHELVAHNPLVTHDGVRSYLGIPLITAKEEAVGALCVIGTRPREFSTGDVARLQTIAEAVAERLEARRAATA